MRALVEAGTRLGRDHSRQHERFRLHWSSHVRNTREQILRCAALVAEPKRVTVLGAGSGYNLPLEELTARFDGMLLVDIDREGLREAVDALPSGVRGRTTAEVADLTGGAAAALLDAGVAAVHAAASAPEAIARLKDITRAALAPLPNDTQHRAWRASCVISSCVASQLALFPYRAIAEVFTAKLGTDSGARLFVEAGFAELRERWARAHSALLAQLVEPGGALYCSDTVAETPCLAAAGREALAAVVDAVASYLRKQGTSALRTFLTDGGKADLASRFAEAVPFQLAATPAGRREQGDRILQALQTDLDPSARRAVAWAFMTAIGVNGLIAPARELELLEQIVAVAEQIEPGARQPIVESRMTRLLPGGLRAEGEPRSWLWFNEPKAAATLEGGAYCVEAQLLVKPETQAGVEDSLS
jgi:hypothetical protein